MEEKIQLELIIDMLRGEIDELREKNSLLERKNLDLRIENLTLKEKLGKFKERGSVGVKSEGIRKYRNINSRKEEELKRKELLANNKKKNDETEKILKIIDKYIEER